MFIAHSQSRAKPSAQKKLKLLALYGKKGQSLVETLVFCLALSFLTQAVLLFFLTAVSFIYMEHQLYQGILCAARGEGAHYCKTKALEQIKKFNPAGQVIFLKINHFQKEGKGVIKWRFLKTNFFIRQTLRLPN